MAQYLKVTWNSGSSTTKLPTKETFEQISGGGGTSIPLQDAQGITENKMYVIGSGTTLGNFITAYLNPSMYLDTSTSTLYVNKVQSIIDDGNIDN